MLLILQVFEKYVKNWIAIAAPFQGKYKQKKCFVKSFSYQG